MEKKENNKIIILIKIIKFASTMGAITFALFLLVQSAENWGLGRQQKMIFYGFFTIFFWVLGCYGVYHVIGKILGKKALGIFLSAFFGIIMFFFVYWISWIMRFKE